MKKLRKKIIVTMLTIILCLSMTTISFAADAPNTNKIETRAGGGGSAVRFISGTGSFSFQVGGSGMSRIRVVASCTSNDNITLVNVTTTGATYDFNIRGNDTSIWTTNNLTTGTYSVYATANPDAAVVAVYVK